MKRTISILLPAVLWTTLALASQLHITDVSVYGQGYATTVAVYADGAFTHTEYRPSESLLLVDLVGVSVANTDQKQHAVHGAGIQSYRLVGYKTATGAEASRLELNVSPGSVADITEAERGLLVKITGGTVAPLIASAPAASGGKHPVESRFVKTPATPLASRPQEGANSANVRSVALTPVTVKNVSVVRSEIGLDLEISGSGSMVPKVMELSSPYRIVVDIPNARLGIDPHEIEVNSQDVKGVRMSRHQVSPPATRIVVDLVRAQKFEVLNEGGKLILKMHSPVRVSVAPPIPSPIPANMHPELRQKASASYPPAPSATLSPTSTYQAANGLPRGNAAAPRPIYAQPVAAQRTAAPRAVAPRTAAHQPVANQAMIRPPLASQNMARPVSAPPAQATQQAKDFVMVEPEYRQVPPDPATRAAIAAAKFGNPPAEVALTNLPINSAGSASLKPELAMPPAMMQQPTAPIPASTCASGPYTGEPISVNLKDVDLRDFFRLIHDVSGLNVVLDPAVNGRLTIVLDDVPWDQALSIVLKNNSLECQLDGNVLRVASVETLRREAEARAAQQTAQSLAVDKVQVTRYLYYASARDTVPTLKQFLSPRGDIVADERTNSLIISDIPNSLPNIDRLLKELDRKTQQVEIEARVVAATRNFARDIGMQLGFGFGNKVSAVGGVAAPGLITTPPTGPLVTLTGGSIPLFSNFPVAGATSGLSFLNFTNNYRLDALLTMAESRGLLKILSRPRIVTQNNVNALVRQGLKVPFITAAQLAGPPTVTFIDAFLRLSVRPQITRDGTIFLNVDVENTIADFANRVGGNPTLITQQATTQVLVSDGGTVVIGGVIQTSNSINIQQVPLLGNIPVLGNLFKRRTVSTSTQELIFFITPRIIET